MVEALAFPLLSVNTDAVLAAVNRQLSEVGLSILREEALMLIERRAESLIDSERVEFGLPALVLIAGEAALSPSLSQADAAKVLADLQDAFYALRDELPVDVPDAEIVEALCGWLDAWGDDELADGWSGERWADGWDD